MTDREFRSAIRRVLNHGESVHQLQRTIHPFAIGPKRGRSRDEQRAISGSLALLANLLTSEIPGDRQAELDRWDRVRRLQGVAEPAPRPV